MEFKALFTGRLGRRAFLSGTAVTALTAATGEGLAKDRPKPLNLAQVATASSSYAAGRTDLAA